MTYVRNAWYVAAWADAAVPERPVGVRVLNEPIVIWRNTAGELAAFEDRCIHRLAPLSLGRCEGERLRCMYHGLLYDRTGRVVEIPGQDRVASSLRVRAYPVVEKHSWIWVWMGEAAAASEDFIPSLGGPDRPDFVFGRGQLDYAAEARLISDNLLDLSHASFLHCESFRVSETWARTRPKISESERGVRIEWWISNEPPMGGLDRSQPPVDTYLRYDFSIPGTMLMMSGNYPVGTADALCDGSPPDFNPATVSFTSQAVTPLTDKTARYFYRMGRRRQGQETSYDMTVSEKAFAEDKAMVEAQQRSLDGAPERQFIASSADRGVVLYNRLVEKLAREESARMHKSSVNVRSRQSEDERLKCNRVEES